MVVVMRCKNPPAVEVGMENEMETWSWSVRYQPVLGVPELLFDRVVDHSLVVNPLHI